MKAYGEVIILHLDTRWRWVWRHNSSPQGRNRPRQKVKSSLCLTKHYATTTYGEVDVQIHVFLTSTRVGGWMIFTPGQFIPRGKSSLFLFDSRLGGLQSRSGLYGEVKILGWDSNSDPYRRRDWVGSNADLSAEKYRETSLVGNWTSAIDSIAITTKPFQLFGLSNIRCQISCTISKPHPQIVELDVTGIRVQDLTDRWNRGPRSEDSSPFRGNPIVQGLLLTFISLYGGWELSVKEPSGLGASERGILSQ
jgi:hypothetical protein